MLCLGVSFVIYCTGHWWSADMFLVHLLWFPHFCCFYFFFWNSKHFDVECSGLIPQVAYLFSVLFNLFLLLLCQRFSWLLLLWLHFLMKFWVHCPLELHENTIWKLPKFSPELALSLSLTGSFSWLFILVLLFMQRLAFPYTSADVLVYICGKALIGGSVWKFQWWISSTSKFCFRENGCRGGGAQPFHWASQLDCGGFSLRPSASP